MFTRIFILVYAKVLPGQCVGMHVLHSCYVYVAYLMAAYTYFNRFVEMFLK
jgi:hypothetical protein